MHIRSQHLTYHKKPRLYTLSTLIYSDFMCLKLYVFMKITFHGLFGKTYLDLNYSWVVYFDKLHSFASCWTFLYNIIIWLPVAFNMWWCINLKFGTLWKVSCEIKMHEYEFCHGSAVHKITPASWLENGIRHDHETNLPPAWAFYHYKCFI